MYKHTHRWLMILSFTTLGFMIACGDVSLQDLVQDLSNGGKDNHGPGAFQADYRTSSDFFTQESGLVQGTSPHSKTQIWYSSNIKDIIGQPAFVVPEGTTAIKEFDNDGTPGVDGIAVMVKKAAGYDPDHSDWYYEMRTVDGQLMQSPPPGRTEMCINCHAAAAATDYLAGTKNR